MERGAPVSSPIPMVLYPSLATLLLSLGLVVTAFFFLYQFTTSRYSRSLVTEAATAVLASVLLGSGTLFLLLWTGVYV